MALTHRIIRRIDLEHEPGSWIEARMPSLDILDRSREARSRRAIKLMEGIDLSQLKDFAGDRQADAESDHDWQTLLRACITSWSYEEPVCPDNIAELDEVTVRAVMAALLPADTEADRKKGSGNSTTHLSGKALRLPSG